MPVLENVCPGLTIEQRTLISFSVSAHIRRIAAVEIKQITHQPFLIQMFMTDLK